MIDINDPNLRPHVLRRISVAAGTDTERSYRPVSHHQTHQTRRTYSIVGPRSRSFVLTRGRSISRLLSTTTSKTTGKSSKKGAETWKVETKTTTPKTKTTSKTTPRSETDPTHRRARSDSAPPATVERATVERVFSNKLTRSKNREQDHYRT